MSQKVVVERASVVGAPVFLGVDSETGLDLYSHRGDDVAEWMSAAWRSSFNRYRSRRCKYGPGHELVPIGDRVDERTDREFLDTASWCASLPNRVLRTAQRQEDTSWFAATKRRSTLRKQGKNPGEMPSFRSFKKDDHVFACWYDRGLGARFERVNSRHGIVTINGRNPKDHRAHGAKWSLRLHVRVSEPVRAYSSVQVNWTRRTLTFTSPPKDRTHEPTGVVTGIDRGVAHNLATDDGTFYDLPTAKLDAMDKHVRALQRANAKDVTAAGCKDQREYKKTYSGGSKTFQRREKEIANLKAKASRIIVDAQQKWTTNIVAASDGIVTEDLHVKNMTATPVAKPDPESPGAYLPNGRSAKRGLNRVMQRAALAQVQSMLVYKADAAGIPLIEVRAAYTSQRCHKCRHTEEGNRESQAVFRCLDCGHTDNADTNAARNIREDGLDAVTAWWDTQAESTNALKGRAGPAAEGRQTGTVGSPTNPLSCSRHEPLTAAPAAA